MRLSGDPDNYPVGYPRVSGSSPAARRRPISTSARRGIADFDGAARWHAVRWRRWIHPRMFEPLAQRLRQADTVVEVAHAILATAPGMLGVLGGIVEAHDERGRPVLCVTSDWVGSAWAPRYLAFGHRADACAVEVRRRHAPVATADLVSAAEARDHAAALGCPEALYRHGVVGALLGDSAPLGLVRLAWPRPPSPRALTDVAILCAHASVRLARIGFPSPAAPPALARLSDRQLEVARLVARGYTNAEVAIALAISPDAVKKHLKLILAAVDVANRTELAALVTRSAAGLERTGDGADLAGVAVTRAVP